MDETDLSSFGTLVEEDQPAPDELDLSQFGTPVDEEPTPETESKAPAKKPVRREADEVLDRKLIKHGINPDGTFKNDAARRKAEEREERLRSKPVRSSFTARQTDPPLVETKPYEPTEEELDANTNRVLEEQGIDTSTAWGDLKAGWYNLRSGLAASRAADAMDAENKPRNLRGQRLTPEYQELRKKLLREQGDEAIVESADFAAKAQAIPQAPAAKAFDQSKTFAESWTAFASDPLTVARSTTLRSAASSMPSVVGGIVGSVLGPGGAAIGAGAGSYIAEIGSAIQEGLAENGANLNDPYSVRAVWQAHGKEIMESARMRSAIIGSADAIGAGLTTKIVAAPVKGLRDRIVKWLASTGVQIGAGAGGETGAQLAEDGSITAPGAIAGEALGEATFGGIETAGQMAVAGGKRILSPTQRVQGGAELPPGAQDVTDDLDADEPQTPPQAESPITGTMSADDAEDLSQYGTPVAQAPLIPGTIPEEQPAPAAVAQSTPPAQPIAETIKKGPSDRAKVETKTQEIQQSVEQRNQLDELLKAGKSTYEISKTLGIPMAEVKKARDSKDLGAKPKPSTPVNTPANAQTPKADEEDLSVHGTPVAEVPSTKTAGALKPIGKNAEGIELFEDARGVRSYVRDGIRITEPVQIVPTRGGMTISTSGKRDAEFEPKPQGEGAFKELTTAGRKQLFLDKGYEEKEAERRSKMAWQHLSEYDKALFGVEEADKAAGDKARLAKNEEYKKKLSGELVDPEWDGPNEHGVYDDRKAETLKFSDKKDKGRTNADIRVMKVDGGWIAASSHQVAGTGGGGGPLTKHRVFKTREEAIADEATRRADKLEQEVETGIDSRHPEPRRAAQRRIVQWFREQAKAAEPAPIKMIDARKPTGKAGSQRIRDFLIAKGGLKDEGGELRSMGLQFMIRKNGLSNDKAREAAVEAGYIHDAARIHGGESESTIQDLLDAIEDNILPARDAAEAQARAEAKKAAQDEDRYSDEEKAVISRIGLKAFDKIGVSLERAQLSWADWTDGELARVAELVNDGMDADDAFDRITLEDEANVRPLLPEEERSEIPFDEVHESTVSEGRADLPASSQEGDRRGPQGVSETSEEDGRPSKVSLDDLVPQDVVRVSLKSNIEEDGQSYGPVIEGSYFTQAGMHFVEVREPANASGKKMLGPIDPDNVQLVERTKTAQDILDDRYGKARGAKFDTELERTRDGYEAYLTGLAKAISQETAFHRKQQLLTQFHDAANEIELAQKKRKWILTFAEYKGGKQYPSRLDLNGDAAEALNLQRPKPTDFDPSKETRKAKAERDPDSLAPRNLLPKLHSEGFGAFTAVTNPDGHPDEHRLIVTMPGGKDNGRAVVSGSRIDGVWSWTAAPYDTGVSSKAGNLRNRLLNNNPDFAKLRKILDRPAPVRTEAGADGKPQTILPGATKVQAKDGPIKSKKPQKDTDFGLFERPEDKSGDLFDAPKPVDLKVNNVREQTTFAEMAVVEGGQTKPADFQNIIEGDYEATKPLKDAEAAYNETVDLLAAEGHNFSTINPATGTARALRIKRRAMEIGGSSARVTNFQTAIIKGYKRADPEGLKKAIDGLYESIAFPIEEPEVPFDFDKAFEDRVNERLADMPDADLADKVQALRDKTTVFASGMSRRGDIESGSVMAGLEQRGLGVEIGEVSGEGLNDLARQIVERKLQTFVDSGAFSLFRAGLRRKEELMAEGADFRNALDFEQIFGRYDVLRSRIDELNDVEDTDVPAPRFVMPDIVGDQAASLALVEQYAKDVVTYPNAIIPIQKGELTLAEAYAKIKETLAPHYAKIDKLTSRTDFIVGIPSNEKAVSSEELTEFLRIARPQRIHFLGLAAEKRLLKKLEAVAKSEHEPESISADANILRSALYGKAMPKGRKAAVSETLRDKAADEIERESIDPADRPARKAAQKLTKNTGKGLEELAKGVIALFNDPNMVGMPFAFNDETYQKSLPYFRAATAHFKEAGKNLTELVNAIVDYLIDRGLNRDGLNNIKPYVRRYMDDLHSGKESLDGQDDNSLDQTSVEPTGEGMADGRARGEGADTSLDDAQPDDGSAPETGGSAEGVRARSAQSRSRSGDKESAGGDDANRRKRGSGEGVAPERAGRDTPRPAPVRPNYYIADPDGLIGGSPKVRFERNKAAIETFRSITEEGRDPTDAERDVLAAYIGWGSFGQELFQGNWGNPKPKDGWQDADRWLRDHLGQDEWESAQSSIINAHYTDPPTVQAMWRMVERMGFKGGRVLEPSMGIGNFFGLMPRNLEQKSQLTGIELDKLTGGMAKLLYPNANVQIKGYQESKTPDGFYDLVIGNWPFAEQSPADRRYDALNLTLHDYFFVKALDQVREGGLVIGITSAGTMDKVGRGARQAMMDKADLVAVYRLPSGAFDKYAGTAVVTDIIILKKRAPGAEAKHAGEWLNHKPLRDNFDVPSQFQSDSIHTNEYWGTHKDAILGTMTAGHGTTYGKPGRIVNRPDNFPELLEKLPERVPEGIYKPVVRGQEPRFITNNVKDREGSIVEHSDGVLHIVQGERLVRLEDITPSLKVRDPRKAEQRANQVKSLVVIRKAYGSLLDAERQGDPDIESKRTILRKLVEHFRKEHGRLLDSEGLQIFRRLKEPSANRLASLERRDGKLAKILTESTIRNKRKLEQPTVRDAFVLMRNESMTLDLDRIAEMTGKPVETVTAELLDSKAIYRTASGGHEVSDVFLSGNVRRKLRELEEAKERGDPIDGSIEAIKAVIPKDTPYFQIEAKMGATWVSNEDYEKFIGELLGVPDSKDIEVRFKAGAWKVKFKNDSLNRRPEADTWGHASIWFNNLLKHAFNNQNIVIKYKDMDGNLVVDEQSSKEANERARRVREEFSGWVWKDSERKVRLERAYNEIMNAIATPKYDGSFLEFPGMTLQRGDDQFSLRKHQIDAIWRGLANKRGLYAHEVGTGKTYTMGGIAVESRRYGLAKKPILFAHNANSATVAREIQEMYPGAQVLYVDNMGKETVKTTIQRIANDDWDLIVVPHSVMDNFTLSEATYMELAREEIAALENEAMEAAKDDGSGLTLEDMDDEKAMGKVRSPTAKQLVKQRNKIIEKIKEAAQRASKEDAVVFEDLGIDMILVDEVHEFKKPPIATKMRMRGLNTGTSDRSLTLRFLTDYVKKVRGGDGIHIFTGTPITNTLTEIFNMQRYVMDSEMEKDGIKSWDAWFNTFADASTDVELTDTGEYEPVTRLASFVNVAELRRMAGQVLDIVFADDMPEFKPRETNNGKTIASPDLTQEERDQLEGGRSEQPIGRPYKRIVNDVGAMSPGQEAKRAELMAMAQDFKQASKKDRRDMMLSGDPRSPLLVGTAAANAGFDMRLIDPTAADDPNSKVNRAVRNALNIYKGDTRATQVIFMERGFSDKGKKSKGRDSSGKKIYETVDKFNLAKDIVEKLVAQGVKREEIAIVDGGTSKEKRKEIADKMNRSEIRVVIGNTKTLGVGVNMQENLRAMHHLDAPWMPGDLEQRNGRGWRQGNKWNTVLEYRYITEKLDGRRWQILSVKDRFIKSFLKADDSVRVIEGDAVDMEEKDSINTTLAEAAGDPRLMLINKFKADVERLENRERLHAYGQDDARSKIVQVGKEIERLNAFADQYEQDLKAAEIDKPFPGLTIDGKHYAERKDAQDALDAVYKNLPVSSTPQHIATYRNFEIVMLRMFQSSGGRTFLHGEMEYEVNPSFASIDATIRNLTKRAADARATAADRQASLGRLDEMSKMPFAQAEALSQKKRLLKEIEQDLQDNPVPPPTWLRQGAPVNTLIYVDGQPREVQGHRWASDGFYVTTAEGPVPYLQAKDEQGQPLYEEHEFKAPVEPKAEEAPRASRPFSTTRARPMEPDFNPLWENDGTVTLEQAKAVIADFNAVAERILGRHIPRIEWRPTLRDAHGPMDAVYWETKNLMQFAQDASQDPRATLRHETIHVLRTWGVITKAEWAILSRISKNKWMKQFGIDARYFEPVEMLELTEAQRLEVRLEEGVAEAYQDYSYNGPRGSAADPIFAKIKRFLEALINFIRHGQFTTVEQIFAAIESGEMGQRNADPNAIRGFKAVGEKKLPGVDRVFEDRAALTESEEESFADTVMAGNVNAGAFLKNLGLAARPPQGPPQQRPSMGFQPVDRVFRAPGHLLGGFNQKGEMRWGATLSDRVNKLVTQDRFDDQGMFSFINPLLYKARAGVLDRYGLSSEYVKRDRQRQLDERAILAEARDVLEGFKSISPQEAEALQKILTGETVTDPQWEGISEPIRRAMDAMGQEAVDLGLLSQEAYDRNKGKYLHRVYKKHETDQSGLTKWVGKMVATRRKRLIGDEFKGRGMFRKVSLAKLGLQKPPAKGAKFDVYEEIATTGRVMKRGYVEQGKPVPQEFAGRVLADTLEVRGISKGKIVLWRDWTKPERQRMGEVMDARYTVAKSYMLAAHDLSVGRFYKDIAENADWATDQEPASGTWVEASDFGRIGSDPQSTGIEWVRVPSTKIPSSNTKRYGKLSGLYVRAEIWRDLHELELIQKETFWNEILKMWKLNKTARSPVVHMNNIMSNFVLLDASGVGATDVARAIRSLTTKDAEYRAAEAAGAFGVDMASQELRETVLRPILDQLAQQGASNTPMGRMRLLTHVANGLFSRGALVGALWGSAAGSLVAGPVGSVTGFVAGGIAGAAARKPVERVDDAMLRLYQLEDEVFRMALFHRRRLQGFNAQESADEARAQFIDYDIRAPIINMLRRSWLPFIAYTYRAVPIMLHTLTTRPWKIAKYMALFYGLNALSHLVLGDDDDDEDKERRSMYDHEQGNVSMVGVPFGPRMVRLPFRDDNGNVVYIDVRRWVPGGDVFDTTQGQLGLWGPLNPSGPAMLVGEVLFNKSLFTGKEVYNRELDDFSDKWGKITGHLYKSFMPSNPVIPESWYWEKIADAIRGKEGAPGRPPQDLSDTLLSSFGIKLRGVDPDEGFRIKEIRHGAIERELQGELRRLHRDKARKAIDPKEADEAIAETIEKLKANAEKRATLR